MTRRRSRYRSLASLQRDNRACRACAEAGYPLESMPVFEGRPGQRAYVPAKQVPKVRNGMGIAIISTSQGVMTDREARHKGVGGEVLCEVW